MSSKESMGRCTEKEGEGGGERQWDTQQEGMGGEKREDGTELNVIRQGLGLLQCHKNTEGHMHTHLPTHPHLHTPTHPHAYTHIHAPTPTQHICTHAHIHATVE